MNVIFHWLFRFILFVCVAYKQRFGKIGQKYFFTNAILTTNIMNSQVKSVMLTDAGSDEPLCLYHSTLCLKNVPDIFSCNSRKHCRIFRMFGTHVTEKVDAIYIAFDHT